MVPVSSVVRSAVAIVALCIAGDLTAQTVYKSVDEKGNVIYSESPPTKSKDGKIKSTKELPIDPNQNVMPATPITGRPYDSGQVNNGQASREENVAQAREALEAAEAQLKSGNETQPGDFVGRAGGGVGPSQQRLQRLQELQKAVDEARQHVEQAQNQ